MSVSIDAVIHLTTLKDGSYLTGCCIGWSSDCKLSRGLTARHLGYGTIPGNLNRILKRLLDEGVIELTESDNPNSPMQRLRFASWRHD